MTCVFLKSGTDYMKIIPRLFRNTDSEIHPDTDDILIHKIQNSIAASEMKDKVYENRVILVGCRNGKSKFLFFLIEKIVSIFCRFILKSMNHTNTKVNDCSKVIHLLRSEVEIDITTNEM